MSVEIGCWHWVLALGVVIHIAGGCWHGCGHWA